MCLLERRIFLELWTSREWWFKEATHIGRCSEGRGSTVSTWFFDGFSLARRKSREVHGLRKREEKKQRVKGFHLPTTVWKESFDNLITIKAALSERRPGWNETRIKNKSFQPEYDIDYTPAKSPRTRKTPEKRRLVFPVDPGNIIRVVFCLVWQASGSVYQTQAPQLNTWLQTCTRSFFREGSQHQQVAPKQEKNRKSLGLPMEVMEVFRKF